MDRLWSPWRYRYIKGETGEKSSNTVSAEDASCVFCRLNCADDDAKCFVVHRAAHCYIVLNIYPYTSGHLMIVPNKHLANLDDTDKATSDELMDLTKRAQTVLRAEYKPEGFNIGINQGRSAGAGVAAHLHIHILPRWFGDANFMTTIAETRVLPEELTTTFARLKNRF